MTFFLHCFISRKPIALSRRSDCCKWPRSKLFRSASTTAKNARLSCFRRRKARLLAPRRRRASFPFPVCKNYEHTWKRLSRRWRRVILTATATTAPATTTTNVSAGPEFGSKLWWGKRDRCTAPWVIRRRSVIQAASQFNALEFPSEHITPEKGILGYEWDNTQGPACVVCRGNDLSQLSRARSF